MEERRITLANYLDKWKPIFPETLGANITRPKEGVSNTLPYNTDGFPQRIPEDPVLYTLENALSEQLFSNDERLRELFQGVKTELSVHYTDPRAHETGISGNAASATKWNTARSFTVADNDGTHTGPAVSVDGTKNVTIKMPGIIGASLKGNADSATNDIKKRPLLSYVREISVTGNTLTIRKGDDTKTDVVVSKPLDAYPVGSIYISAVNTDPHDLFGGVWVPLEQGRLLLAAGSQYPAGSVGGEKTHTLTIDELPKHNHGGLTLKNGAHSHNGTTSTRDLRGEFDGIQYINTYGSGIVSMRKQGRKNNPGGEDPRDVHIFTVNATHDHTFTTDTKGEHTHQINFDGESKPHNNMPPYISVYMWRRIS